MALPICKWLIIQQHQLKSHLFLTFLRNNFNKPSYQKSSYKQQKLNQYQYGYFKFGTILFLFCQISRFDITLRSQFVIFIQEMGTACLSSKRPSQNHESNPEIPIQSSITKQADSQLAQEPTYDTPKKNTVRCPSTAISTSSISNIENTHQKNALEDSSINPQNETDPFNPLEDLEFQEERQRTRSSIIRLPSKVKKSQSDPKSNSKSNKQVLEGLQRCQGFEGQLKTEKLAATITISNQNLDIQFTLPRCRAGPIVVPFVDYSKYSIQE